MPLLEILRRVQGETYLTNQFNSKINKKCKYQDKIIKGIISILSLKYYPSTGQELKLSELQKGRICILSL